MQIVGSFILKKKQLILNVFIWKMICLFTSLMSVIAWVEPGAQSFLWCLCGWEGTKHWNHHFPPSVHVTRRWNPKWIQVLNPGTFLQHVDVLTTVPNNHHLVVSLVQKNLVSLIWKEKSQRKPVQAEEDFPTGHQLQVFGVSTQCWWKIERECVWVFDIQYDLQLYLSTRNLTRNPKNSEEVSSWKLWKCWVKYKYVIYYLDSDSLCEGMGFRCYCFFFSFEDF